MPKSRSNLPDRITRRGRAGNVPIIEIAEQRHNVRIAKLTFWVVGLVGWPTIAVITYGVLGPHGIAHALLAASVGFLAALALAVTASLVVLAWPVVRVLWHWAAEITLGAVLLAGYLALVQVVSFWLALAILAACTVAPMVLPFTRHAVTPVVWCAVWRHRLRLSFDAFIKSNRYGSVPFILTARPTPAGGRIWVWLRPGLSLADLEARLDKLAVACWAKEIKIAPASNRHAALIRVDVTARDPLTAKVLSPLTRLIPLHRNASDDAPVSPALAPTALDLTDVPEDDFSAPADAPATERKPLKPVRTTTPATAPAPAATSSGDDLSDWI
ncbi:hypothetical protein [Planosporangium mesophilum]|uniref:Uncharacterized protein n=1 Tax=Planosporangium mesophilum TaxID=689768 RepID=A0A8J3TAU5_9ACTN|nr:hypothetical protein [Planosporangium mesophilum]NJC85352.1 hypothetical protein [Planosporangium mesophilum]GII23183.1 hypothetical protein Pme01_27800 [Planosporangium mesophilum]